jgi:A/G-specific adenine glycosylase
MDLGATLCRPRQPQCTRCPVQGGCRAYRSGAPEQYPARPARKKTPTRHANVFVVVDEKGRALLRQRPEKGLLGGMWEFPSTPWEAGGARLPRPGRGWVRLKEPVTHVFSHFRLNLTLHIGRKRHSVSILSRYDKGRVWKSWRKIEEMALPTLMRKVAHAAKPHLGFSE